jgi:hypothetical protein
MMCGLYSLSFAVQVAFVTRSCAGCTIASTYSMSLTRLRIGAVSTPSELQGLQNSRFVT